MLFENLCSYLQFVCSKQLNIFLAILVEGYTTVKNGISQTQGILQEVIGLLGHEMRRAYQLFGSGDFISDDFLAAELSKCLNQTPTTAARALHDYSSIALGNRMQVQHKCQIKQERDVRFPVCSDVLNAKMRI